MVCEVCGASTAHLERKDDHRHTRSCSKECRAVLISRAKLVLTECGMTRAKLASEKSAITKRSDVIDGEDAFKRGAKKAAMNMELAGTRAVATRKRLAVQVFDEEFSIKIRRGMSKVGDDGLTSAQRAGAKARLANIESGRFIEPSNLPAFKLYQRTVHRLTRSQDLSSLPNFDKRGHVEKGGWHIDHRLSITEGFLQGATPEELSHILNLEMLPAKENIKKSTKSTLLLQDLRDLIKNA